MDKLRKFSRIINGEKYLFHLHTSFTDGKLTLQEYFEYANENGIYLIFTEHIRKNVTYNWKEYIDDVHRNGYLAGFEAKILPNGKVDILDEALNDADIIGIAVHSFPKRENLTSALRMAFKKYSKIDVPLVWVHPYTSNLEREFVKMSYIKQVMEGFERRIYLEFNVKKKNFSKEELEFLKNKYQFVVGCDAHTKEDLKLCEE